MDVLEAYLNTAARRSLPRMERANVVLKTKKTLTDPQALWTALREVEPMEGWLQFQSKQLALGEGNLVQQPRKEWGFLLAAEAVTRHGESVVVGGDGAGGWRLAVHAHQKEGDLLCDEIVQLAHDAATGRLRYRRYWRPFPGQGYVQVSACFIGFEKG